jgi:hypothetical protein
MPETIFTIKVDSAQAAGALRELDALAKKVGASLSQATSGGAGANVAGSAADRAAKSYTQLGAQFPALVRGLEQQAKLQGGQVIPSTVRLSTTIDQLTGRMVNHLSAQTQLDNGMMGHVSTIDRAGAGLSRYTSLLSKMAASMIVWEGFRAVTQTINEVIDAQIRLSGEVARFGIITGESIDQAKQSYMGLQAVMAEQGVKPSESGSSILRIARLTKNPAEQQEISRVSAQMSQVLGIDVGTATEKLIAILEQEKRSGTEAGQVFDELIAIYKDTGSSVDEIVNAMTEAAVIQDKWGTSSIETKGLIAELSQTANESAETVSGALIRVTNEIQSLEGQKLVDVSRMFREMGIEIQDTSTGKILPALDILKNISVEFGGLSPENQAKIYEALGLEKPQYQQIGRELMSALADGEVGNLEVIRGAGQKAGEAFGESFQGAVNKMLAQQEILQEGGGFTQNVGAQLLTSTVGRWGGKSGAEWVTQQLKTENMQAAFGQEGGVEANKETFLKSLYGLSPDEAKAAIAEYNRMLAVAYKQAIQVDPFNFGTLTNRAGAGMISDEDYSAALSAAAKSPANKVSGTGGYAPPSAPKAGTSAQEPESIYTAEGELKNRLRNVQDYLPTGAVDMSTLSTDQFNQALRESEQIFYAILEAQRREMELTGLTKEEVDAKIDAMIEEAKLQEILVEKAGKQYEYVRGIAGINLKDVLGGEKYKDAAKPPDFQFKRLRDVDPSQFGQLNALTQMYDKFLTNIGSPEKKQNINLLLGEQNVFKTMNGRMSALQMALEDLTKVEKAQLSGTWNMPAGATALVPISSLDIQRWNQSGGGGGLSEEAIRALMGATSESGDTVAGSMQSAATRIIAAIQESAMKAGLPMDKISQAKTPAEAAKLAREELLAKVGGAMSMRDKAYDMMKQTLNASSGERTMNQASAGDYEDAGPRNMRLRQMYPAAKQVLDYAKTSQVTVSAMPIKAVFNASLSLNMNGQIVARAILPIMYQMISKLTASTGTRPKGVQR